MGGAEQAGAGGGAAKDTGPRTGATERDDTAAMPTVVGRSDQLASVVDRFTECLRWRNTGPLPAKDLQRFSGPFANMPTHRGVAVWHDLTVPAAPVERAPLLLTDQDKGGP